MAIQLSITDEFKPPTRPAADILRDIKRTRSMRELEPFAHEDMSGLTAEDHRSVVEQVVIQARTLLKVASGYKQGVWSFGFCELSADESERIRRRVKP